MEDRAMSRLAVPKVRHNGAVEVVKAMSVRMVAVVGTVFTVQTQVPFP